MAIKKLRTRQKEYAESTKQKIDTRRSKVPRRPSPPNAKKPIRHTIRQ
jgi:hypothetical protein